MKVLLSPSPSYFCRPFLVFSFYYVAVIGHWKYTVEKRSTTISRWYTSQYYVEHHSNIGFPQPGALLPYAVLELHNYLVVIFPLQMPICILAPNGCLTCKCPSQCKEATYLYTDLEGSDSAWWLGERRDIYTRRLPQNLLAFPIPSQWVTLHNIYIGLSFFRECGSLIVHASCLYFVSDLSTHWPWDWPRS